ANADVESFTRFPLLYDFGQEIVIARLGILAICVNSVPHVLRRLLRLLRVGHDDHTKNQGDFKSQPAHYNLLIWRLAFVPATSTAKPIHQSCVRIVYNSPLNQLGYSLLLVLCLPIQRRLDSDGMVEQFVGYSASCCGPLAPTRGGRAFYFL